MPSPFPGMNPYLEHPSVWSDFHLTFIPALRAALAPLVRPNYFVQIGEHIYLHDAPDDRRLVGISDVDVAERTGRGFEEGGGSATTVTVPEVVRERSAYLEVCDRTGHRMVTVIELLSPANKYAGDDRGAYLNKRRALLRGGVNFVELDFLRGGPRMPLRDLPPCDYYAMVYRPPGRPKADVWPVRVRESLPSIPIPLSPGDQEPVVDLQAVFQRAFDSADYEPRIYDQNPEPRLSPEDAAWAEALIAPRAGR